MKKQLTKHQAEMFEAIKGIMWLADRKAPAGIDPEAWDGSFEKIQAVYFKIQAGR